MKTRLRKWGNSLALRIPKSFAAEAGLQPDAAVEMSLVKGRVVVKPVAEDVLTLEQCTRERLVAKDLWFDVVEVVSVLILAHVMKQRSEERCHEVLCPDDLAEKRIDGGVV